VTAPGGTEALPDTIGPYRVLSLLGEGGMGAVYLADQLTPHRRVALKVIKAGMDTRQVVARFEAERQALALMDHPNIATVFDAGEASTGRPYFAMEYVAGVPITDYCDRHHLSTRERLALFLQVCGAIQHAHQKGVIHRDIKPSNVLVTVMEGTPIPKVIDFGVAKATNQRLTEKTLFTQLGLLIGTPEYMSPEQAEMTGLDVDTTTDIYAMGVLLYELLVGALPFDSARLRRAGYAEIQRIIREEEPAKPSTRFSSLGATGREVARRRQTDPASLARELRGDLDWITLKALEKDRTHRYPSASEFAADLRRYLADEPVVARPAGVRYRAKKFVRRHRAAVAAATVVLLLLSAFGVTMAVQSARIAAERDVAARERDRAERVSAFLVSLFEASDPDRSKGEKVSARQLLDAGRQRLASELRDEPQSRAALLHTIGRVYRVLDLNDLAKPVLLEALEARQAATGRERADLADTMSELARVYASLGDLDRAEAIDEDVLRIRREVYGAEHQKIAQTMSNQGINLSSRGRYAEAEQRYRDAADVARHVGASGDAAVIQVNIATALINQSRLLEAIEVLRGATALLTETFGLEHVRTQAAMNNLGAALTRTGQFEEAERLQREILRVRRKLLGSEHFDVAVALYNLASTLDGLGRFTEAEKAFEEGIGIHLKQGRGPHTQHAWALAGLAQVQRRLDKLDLAEGTYQSAIAMFDNASSTPTGTVAYAWDGLGAVFYARGRLDQSEKAFRRALHIRRAAGEKGGHGVAESLEQLAMVLCERNAVDEGMPLVQEALAIRRGANLASGARLAFTEAVVGRCLAAQGHFDEAESLLTQAHATLLEERGAVREERKYAAASLAALYGLWKKPDRAAAWREKAR